MRDELIRADNTKRGRKLCERCGGTGNELMSMWRRCSDCGGSGRHEYTKPKPRFKLSPELVDGDSWTPVDTISQVVEAVQSWCDESGQDSGESFTVEVVMMSDQEIDALPEL